MRQSGKSIYFDAEEFDDLAEYHELLDNIEEAKAIIESGLKIHPANSFLLLKKAKYIIYEGNYTNALEFLKQNFECYDFEAHLLKLECYLQLNKYNEANLLAQEVLNDTENEEYVIFSELGFIYAETDYHDDAIQLFEQSLLFKPDNMEVLTELTYSYELCNNFTEAISTVNKILDIDPYSYEAWINLGKLHLLQEEFEKAVDAFDFAIAINEYDTDVLKLKAHCLALSDRIPEAVELLEECVQENPLDKNLYYSLSECYLSLENFDKMFDALDKYTELNGETDDLYAKKALVHLHKGNIDESCRILYNGLKLFPDSDDLHVVAGEIYFNIGEFDTAEKFFEKTYINSSRNSVMLDKLSLICIAKNDIERAIEYTECLLKVNTEPLLKTRMALLYFEANRIVEFNDFLDTFTDKELRELVNLFFSEEKTDLSGITRNILIDKLNNARECRQLFKNISF